MTEKHNGVTDNLCLIEETTGNVCLIEKTTGIRIYGTPIRTDISFIAKQLNDLNNANEKIRRLEKENKKLADEMIKLRKQLNLSKKK